MNNEKTPKNPKFFSCEKCNFITSNKKDFSRHLTTAKHQRISNDNINDNDFSQITPKQYRCNCGKVYKYSSGLSVHKRKCKHDENNEGNDIIEIGDSEQDNSILSFKDMFLEMVHQNKELQKVICDQNKTIQDMVPKIGNNNTNTNNINTVNNVSITVFLNDNCKDALSMDDFIQQIKLEVGDLLFTGKHGLTNGLSNIFIENYNKLPLVKRPLWCSDKKRKRLFIKNDVWEEDKDNMKTKEAIKQLGVIQAKSTPMYAKDNPNWIKDERTKDIYMGIINQTTGDVNEKVDKVIDSLIDKTHLSNEAREKIINNL